MNSLLDCFHNPTCTRLGWTLIHFLWQGSVVALALGTALRAMCRASSQTRYLAGCLALAVMTLAPVLTFIALPSGELGPQHGSSGVPVTFSSIHLESSAPAADQAFERASVVRGFEMAVPWLTVIWMAGVGFFSLRLTGGWWRVRRLCTEGTEPVAEPLLEALDALRAKLGMTQPVRLLKSALVEVPSVVGWLRPVILLPGSALTGLTPAQLESVLAHELAHIKRHDFLVNLFQRVVETLLFYHPAVWWVSAIIRHEREHCCDEMAVALCGDPVGYARTLAALEELRANPLEFALAASDGSLADRVRRLLGHTPDKGWRWRRSLGLILVTIVLLAVVAQLNGWLGSTLYAAETRILVRAVQRNASTGENHHDPYFIQTAFEQLRSAKLIYSVIEKLNLRERFRKRTGGAGPLSNSEINAQLMKRIEIRQARNSSVIEIKAFGEDPNEAAEISNEIALEFLELHTRERSEGMVLLEKEVQRMRAGVGQAQEQLARLREEFGVSESGNGTNASDTEAMRYFEREHATVELKLASRKAWLEAMGNLPKEQRAEVMSTPGSPDASLEKLRSDLHGAEQEFAKLLSEFGAEHPRVKGVRDLMNTIRKQMDERVAGIFSAMEAEVKRTETEKAFMEKKIGEARQADLKLTEQMRQVFELKRECENRKRHLDAVELRLRQEEVEFRTQNTNPVSIIQKAVPSHRPVWRW